MNVPLINILVESADKPSLETVHSL